MVKVVVLLLCGLVVGLAGPSAFGMAGLADTDDVSRVSLREITARDSFGPRILSGALAATQWTMGLAGVTTDAAELTSLDRYVLALAKAAAAECLRQKAKQLRQKDSSE